MDIEKLLEELRPQFYVKDFSQAGAKADGAASCPPASRTTWSERFYQEYVISHSAERDDLVFFVKRENGQNSREQEVVEVLRRTSKLIPALSDTSVLWDQTFYLNLILHEFEYHVTCAAISVDPETECLDETLMKISQQVYPSPSKRRMDKKGDCDLVYPNLMFCLDNFEELFASLHISSPGQRIAVQLIAVNKRYSISQLVFLGAMRYSKLLEIHSIAEQQQQQSQELKFSLFSLRPKSSRKVGQQPYQYFRMRGPQNKGHAEMAIWKVQPPKSSSSSSSSSSLQPTSGSSAGAVAIANGNGHSEPCTPSTVTIHKQGVENSSTCNSELRHILRLESPSENSASTTGTPTAAATASADHFSKETRTSANLSHPPNSEGEFQENSEIPRLHPSWLGQNHDRINDRSTSVNGDKAECGNGDSGFNEHDDDNISKMAAKGPGPDDTDHPRQKYDKGAKDKSFNKKRRSLSKFSKKREKSSVSSPSPLVFAYLTYIKLPWYFLVEDILNNTKKQIF